jgi:hypothetical protein
MMADRETELERLCDAMKAREDALLSALDALMANWRQREQQYRNMRPHDEATADTLRGCTKELAAVLATQREAR